MPTVQTSSGLCNNSLTHCLLTTASIFFANREQLEKGKTYDELWNAAQLEMVRLGKMHGFMRM